jgi:hypothetical protein
MTSTDAFGLPAILDITKAQELRGHMVDRLNGGAVLVDASAVDRVSTPCIQVLLAAARSGHVAQNCQRVHGALRSVGRSWSSSGIQELDGLT